MDIENHRAKKMFRIANEVYQWFIRRWIFFIIWFPVGAFAVYLKISAVLSENYYSILAQALHRPSGYPASKSFTILERISLLSNDIGMNFILIPFIIFLLLIILPRKFWSAILAFIGIVVSLILFFQLQSYQNVGHFVPWYLISDALQWGWQHPQFISEYLTISGVSKLAILIVAIVISSLFIHNLSNKTHHKILVNIVTAGIISGLVLAVVGMTSGIRKTLAPSHFRATISEALTAIFMGDQLYNAYTKIKSPDMLRQEYATFGGITRRKDDKDYWGRAKDYDVIVFILETSPAKYQSFITLDDLPTIKDDLPTIKNLAAHSWHGIKHYSTFPYTAKATFSILTSLYPPNLATVFSGESKQVPGLVRSLSREGYETRYYVPHAFENSREDAMYTAIGFNKIFASDAGKRSMPFGQQYYEAILKQDIEAFSALKHDILDLIKEGKRYLTVFSPQIGHAPWPDIVSNGSEILLNKRARALLTLQDQWLGQLVELLAKESRISNTLIVVTGDHGVRTATEDPSFEPNGLILDYSFHVPFLVFAPGILEAPQFVTHRTTHIDIMPTVLSLLGINQGREFEQGLPIWDSRGSDRTVFLWADDYLGSDGFCRREDCFIWNKATDFVYYGSQLEKEKLNLIPPDTNNQKEPMSTLKDMAILNAEWVGSALLPNDTATVQDFKK